MVRAPCCEKMGLKKGPWTVEEDRILISYIQKNGHSNWRALPKQAGLSRCGKSCRLRWINYLRPDIKRGNFTFEEEETIMKLHESLGNRWSAIAAQLPGRTDNEIKNVWHTHLKKRLMNNEQTQPNQNNKRQKKNSGCSSKTRSTSVKCEAGSNGQTEDPKCSNGDSDSKSVQGPAASSPERSCSDDVSSMITEAATASSTEEALNMSSSEYFLEIDESFWSDAALSSADNSVSPPSRFEYGSAEVGSGSVGFGYDDENVRAEMDFWYDLFMRTAGQLDLDLGEF